MLLCCPDPKRHGYHCIAQAPIFYYQKDGIDNHTYHREFLAHIETIETYGGVGAIGVTPTFITSKLKEMADGNTPLIVDTKKPPMLSVQRLSRPFMMSTWRHSC